MSSLLPKLVDACALHSLLQKSIPNLKVLDCTYKVGPAQPYKLFKKEYYGQFEKLILEPSWQKAEYLKAHIPGSIHIDLNAAFFPAEFQRFGVYEPDVFEQYARLLGINKEDHLVFYGRGPGAMLFPARIFWLFKSYGHTNASILNGGLGSWQKEGYELESLEEPLKPQRGNWTAKDCLNTNYITFEELTSHVVEHENTETVTFDNKLNILDARVRAQFEGDQPFGVAPNSSHIQGSNILGSKNVPALELLNEDGTIKSESEILGLIQKSGCNLFGKNTKMVTLCNVGMQASLLAFAVELVTDSNVKLYNGSMFELSRRAPHLINGGQSSS
uniref:Rhodanese domain-containing protein n=1 Tax=Ditylenchus dipsaci TaxID=166011 RepID=A0A915DBK7_9BILA